ncbi:unannotated protein [freshwater metagenome]|uniref:Unannotated protein n=1 Tax=freshwater metagenome TaxID=449393 RepID=A0A6J6HAK6_9ZZZZ
MHAVGDVVLAKGNGECAERVGLDDIAADLEIAGVDVSNDIGSGDDEEFVASLEVGSAEVVGGHTAGLNTRAHAAVENDDTFMDCFKESAHRGSPGDGPGAERGSDVISPQAGASCPTHQVSFGSHTVAERRSNPTLEASSARFGL